MVSKIEQKSEATTYKVDEYVCKNCQKGPCIVRSKNIPIQCPYGMKDPIWGKITHPYPDKMIKLHRPCPFCDRHISSVGEPRLYLGDRHIGYRCDTTGEIKGITFDDLVKVIHEQDTFIFEEEKARYYFTVKGKGPQATLVFDPTQVKITVERSKEAFK